MSNIKAVFIDRDGTISADKGYVFRIEDFELLPSSLEALKLLTQGPLAKLLAFLSLAYHNAVSLR